MTTEQRLDALERELGRTKRVHRWLLAVIGVIVVAGFTALTVTGQEKRVATELRARAFILEDANGKTAAVLGVFAGAPALSLHGANGKTRAVLSLLTDGNPGLRLYDANGKMRAGLSLLADDTPALSLHDANGKERAWLIVHKDSGPGLDLYDANGVLFWATPEIKRTP
jgi:hypothetical protein